MQHSATDAQTIQRLEQENSELQAENAFSKEQRADLANATQQANALALKLQQLDDVASANSLQGRIEAEVAKRVAAVEEKHATQLREKDEALQQAAAQLDAKDAEMLGLKDDVLQMDKMITGTLRIVKFCNLVSRYSTQRLSFHITKEVHQEMARIKDITGKWYGLVLRWVLRKSRRQEVQLLKKNKALSTRCTQLIRRPEAPAKAECVICMEKSPTHAMAVCGHVVYCQECAKNQDDTKCPLCRAPFKQQNVRHVVQIYAPAPCD